MREDPYTLFVCLDPGLNEARGYLYEDDFHSVSRAGARFFSINYQSVPSAKGSQNNGGGWLQLTRLPLPGVGVESAAEQQSTDEHGVNYIERIVFVGLTKPFKRATVVGDGPRRNLELVQSQGNVADSKYLGAGKTMAAVVSHASLPLKTTWKLHLTSEVNEVFDEL